MISKYHGRIAFSVSLLEEAGSGSYLDIGCGTGWSLRSAAVLGIPFAVGIDTNELVLRECVKICNVNLVVASALRLPFKNSVFRTITSWDVIEHLPPKREMVMCQEITRVLISKGIYIMSTPNNNIINNYLDPAWWFGHRHYSVRQIIDLCDESVLTIRKYHIKGGVIDMIATILFYINIWIFGNRDIFNKFLDMMRDYDYRNDKKCATIFCQFSRT